MNSSEYGQPMTEYSVIIEHGITFLAQITLRGDIIFVSDDTALRGSTLEHRD